MGIKMDGLQDKQDKLDDFITDFNEIEMTESELLKNMILACHDEITEVEDAPEDVSEYIDVLHFVLSIANKMGFELSDSRMDWKTDTLRGELLKFTRLSRVFKHWSDKTPSSHELSIAKECLDGMVDLIHEACVALGSDMFEEYNKKHDINIQRQYDGY